MPKRSPAISASDGEQKAFGEELAEQAGAAGAEGNADGDFAMAGGSAGEQKVADVDAGDEQNHADDGHQDSGDRRGVAARVGSWYAANLPRQ